MSKILYYISNRRYYIGEILNNSLNVCKNCGTCSTYVTDNNYILQKS